MECIHSFLVAEDDLDEDIDFVAAGTSEEVSEQQQDLAADEGSKGASLTTQSEVIPEWRVCSYCRPMPQDIENKCCKLEKCITLSSRFSRVCLDPDGLNCVYVIQVISGMTEKILVLRLFVKLHIGNLFCLDMDIWEKKTVEFVGHVLC